MSDILKQFVILWSVIDPIGTIPVFLAVTAKYANQEISLKLAVRATIIAAIVLLFFIITGEFLLDMMDIPLSAFQIAGAIVLFIFALTMIFGESKPEEEISLVKSNLSSAVFPLAIPSIASPGAMMAVVLLTDNNRFSVIHQVITSLIVLMILIITLIIMLLATKIQKIIGLSGASLISRVMGLILASVAVNAFLTGVTTYFKINVS